MVVVYCRVASLPRQNESREFLRPSFRRPFRPLAFAIFIHSKSHYDLPHYFFERNKRDGRNNGMNKKGRKGLLLAAAAAPAFWNLWNSQRKFHYWNLGPGACLNSTCLKLQKLNKIEKISKCLRWGFKKEGRKKRLGKDFNLFRTFPLLSFMNMH